jgi:hypothetical protein
MFQTKAEERERERERERDINLCYSTKFSVKSLTQEVLNISNKNRSNVITDCLTVCKFSSMFNSDSLHENCPYSTQYVSHITKLRTYI